MKTIEFRKKLIGLLLLVVGALWWSQCLLLNRAGLNPGHESGVEASERIVNAAILADATYFASTTGVATFSVFDLIAGELAGIEPSSYYKSLDVDGCISKIQGPIGLILHSPLTAISCNLKADNLLYDP